MGLTKEQILVVDSMVARFIFEYPCYEQDEIDAGHKGHPPPIDPDTGIPKKALTTSTASSLKRPPPYCLDRYLAMSVLDFMIAEGCAFYLEFSNGTFACTFSRDGYGILGQATSEHSGIAICIAALRAHGFGQPWFPA